MLEQRFIEGAQVKLECFSGGKGELVVLVPGLGRAAEDYTELAECLIANGFRVAVVNPRGIGRSLGSMDQVTLYDLAADVLLVAERLGAPQAHLVGYTLGNRIVRCAAHLRPGEVKSLTLLGAGGKVGPEATAAAAGQRFMESLVGQRALTTEERRAAVSAAYLSPNTVVTDHFLQGWCAEVAFLQHAALQRTPFDGWWSGGGTCPVLVIQGQDDRLAPPSNGTLLREDCGERVHVVTVPGSGHLVLDEKPSLVVEEVCRHLKLHSTSLRPQTRAGLGWTNA